MGASEKVRRKKSGGDLDEIDDCVRVCEIEVCDCAEPVEERGVCVDVKKKKKKKKKGKERIIGLCDSLGSSQCAERNSCNLREEDVRDSVEEKLSGDGQQVKRRKPKRRSRREKNGSCNSLGSNEIGQHLVKESEGFAKEMLSEENRAQVCLKDRKGKSKRKKRAKRKSELVASKERKHSVCNLIEDNVGVSGERSADASIQGAETVQKDNADVQEALLLELHERKHLGMPSEMMENEKNECLKIYKRKNKRKKAKGKIELSNSLTSKLVDQNLLEECEDTVGKKSFDEIILGTSIVHEDTNDLQEGLLPNLEENGERNEGLSLSKVRDVADCSLLLSAQNMNLDGASSDLYASIGRIPLNNTRKKLLVIDLNGILVDIVTFVPKGYRCDTMIGKKYSFGTEERGPAANPYHFPKAAVKSAATDQSHCTRTGYTTLENSSKPLVLKELRKLWDKHDPNLPWELGEYNQSNTLLLDDSPYKALRNPPNTAVFPAPFTCLSQNDNSLGPEGDLRVYLERLAIAEDVQKYVEQHPFGQRPISSKNPSWGFYLKIAQQKQSCDSTLTSRVVNDRKKISHL
ncbi:hypothetical protein Sjap_014970 [Stephania japonica]|uniref:Mitochondrial import inner membrane translocase subunit TIM50 n=1 Tax=Stephania japonica TaxID=461633 RepID=A0AAP0IID5_9MAGN